MVGCWREERPAEGFEAGSAAPRLAGVGRSYLAIPGVHFGRERRENKRPCSPQYTDNEPNIGSSPL